MKCIWRILLGVVTAGISELIRHKGHDKTQPCPDQQNLISLDAVSVTDLSIGDIVVYDRKFAWLESIDLSTGSYYFATINQGSFTLNEMDAVYRVVNL